MITIDLHTHTHYSHGANSPADMFAAAQTKGITLYGFSEHSPRPLGYDYPKEYREHLTQHMPDYAREVHDLQKQYPGQVLFGLETDWMDAEESFIRTAITAYPYDYLLGSVHFLGTWGFDADPADWANLSDEACAQHYSHYFTSLTRMIRSGFFQIAAHLDIIKIFSAERFHAWCNHSDNFEMVRTGLLALKENNMALEISSAGIRKLCKEIYPCPRILAAARDLNIPITFASDAHATQDVGRDFARLESYAKAFGYTQSVWYADKQWHSRSF